MRSSDNSENPGEIPENSPKNGKLKGSVESGELLDNDIEAPIDDSKQPDWKGAGRVRSWDAKHKRIEEIEAERRKVEAERKASSDEILDGILEGSDMTVEELQRIIDERRASERREERIEEAEILAERTAAAKGAVVSGSPDSDLGEKVRSAAEYLENAQLRRIDEPELRQRIDLILEEVSDEVLNGIGGPKGLDTLTIAVAVVAKLTGLGADGSLEWHMLYSPHLVAGSCQAGKSAIRNAVISIVADLKLTDAIIVSCGMNDSTRSMQKLRVERYLPDSVRLLETPDNDVTASTAGDLAEDLVHNRELGFMTVIISKSNKMTLTSLNLLVQETRSLDPDFRFMMAADEADEAHLGLRLEPKGKPRYNQGICGALTRLYELLDGPMVWFTATPMPLLGQDRGWALFPRRVTVAKPDPDKSGYYNNAAILEGAKRSHLIDQWTIDNTELPDAIVRDDLCQFGVTRWVLDDLVHHGYTLPLRFPDLTAKPAPQNGGSHVTLINNGLEHEKHDITKAAFRLHQKRVISVLQYRIDTGRWPGSEGKRVKKSIGRVRRRIGAGYRAQGLDFKRPKLEDILAAIKQTKIVVHNMNEGGPWREHRGNEIVIAGLRAARGVSTDGLVGMSWPWSPKRIAHDTFLQRGRYQGYREDVIHLFRLSVHPSMIPDLELMATSETFLTAQLLRLDRANVDLRAEDIPYITAPGHDPCGIARQGELVGGRPLVSSKGDELRLDRVPYIEDTRTIQVEPRNLRTLRDCLSRLGEPDIKWTNGHISWLDVPISVARDLLVLTSDPRRESAAETVEDSLDVVNVTLYAGQSRFARKVPSGLRDVHPNYRSARLVRRQADGEGTGRKRQITVRDENRWSPATVKPSQLISSYSEAKDGTLTKWHDLALDVVGDPYNGKRDAGNNGHLVLYPVELTIDDAGGRKSRVIPGGVAVLAALKLPTESSAGLRRREWVNESDRVEVGPSV